MRIGSFTWWFFITFIIAVGALYAFRTTVPFRPTTSVSETFREPSPATPEPQIEPLKITFVGDIMLDRHIRTLAEREGYLAIIDPLLCEYLRSADLVVGNLEGPITAQPSVSQGSIVGSPQNYRFTFDPNSISLLTHCNINLVNLGNNHMGDFGAAGRLSTHQALIAAGVNYFGDTGKQTYDSDQPSYVWQDERGSIGFVNYNQFVPGSWERTLAAVQQLSQGTDLVIVYTHWGIEYQTTHNPTLQSQAKQLIDAGAGLIIGTHPHVIGPTERIQDVEVYYSLGNFVFDQYFSPDVKKGLVVDAEIDFETMNITTSTTEVEMALSGITTLKP